MVRAGHRPALLKKEAAHMAEDNVIQVVIDPRQEAEIRELLKGVEGGAGKAISAAINSTARTGRSKLARAIGKIINMPVGSEENRRTPGGLHTISEYVRRGRHATPDRLASEVKVTREEIPLSAFGARQTKGGVSVLVRRSEGRKVLKGTFLARMKSGHIGVFHREGKKRLPILERFGPTPLGVLLGTPGLKDEVDKNIQQDFQKNLASKINWLLNRKAQ
jgi:hypothetical protein